MFIHGFWSYLELSSSAKRVMRVLCHRTVIARGVVIGILVCSYTGTASIGVSPVCSARNVLLRLPVCVIVGFLVVATLITCVHIRTCLVEAVTVGVAAVYIESPIA